MAATSGGCDNPSVEIMRLLANTEDLGCRVLPMPTEYLRVWGFVCKIPPFRTIWPQCRTLDQSGSGSITLAKILLLRE